MAFVFAELRDLSKSDPPARSSRNRTTVPEVSVLQDRGSSRSVSMEKQSISPQPGVGNLSDWIVKPYSIVFAVVVFFIIIFGIALFLGYRQFNDTRKNVLTADKTTANLLADLILQHNRATIGILQSYANRPLFIDATKKKDLAAIDRHLSDLKNNADIDVTFVADKSAILLTNLPVFPESRGKDFSQRDWYKGISADWKPYISNVFKQIVGDKLLAVTVCVPIFDEKRRPIGILGNSQRLNYIDNTIEKVAFSPYTTVNVIDRAGKILYSNNISYLEKITDYRFFPIIEPAVKGKKQQIEMSDPQKNQGKRYLTVVPIGETGWAIIIERSLRDIYRSDLRRFIEIGAVSILLFLLIGFFLVYLRKVFLFRKTEELLQAETKLRQGEKNLQALFSRQEALLSAIPDIVMEVDVNKVYTWSNQAGLQFFGEDVIGKEAAFYFVGEQEIYQSVNPLFDGDENVIYVESWQRRKDGQKRLLAWWCRVLKDERGQVTGALSSARDITDSRRVEDDRKEALEKYRLLADHVDSVYAVDKEYIYLFMNERHLKRFGLSLEEVVGKKYDEFHSAEDTRQFKESIDEVFKTGNPITTERSSERDGKIFLRTFTPVIGQSSHENESQVTVYSKDITDIKLSEKQLQNTLESLRRAVGVTIQVLASAVETRDPYTSGHQTRSANLARAIAIEMELPQDKIEGIRMAGSIHDLGKISIPAEILSKPGKLSEIELALIKEHANRGYEMLKDVISPWPLAEIVRQHHERMDGSGYPRNLKRDEILIEARILAVADVVEAMASHRPYRPGLGIDAALKEIEKNRGIVYDSTVADACLRLFREKGFKLEGAPL
jgi:PAS domain S-box-containing protein